MGNYQSHSTYLSVNPDIDDGRHYSATFENNYFAQGTCRYALRGILHGDGPRNNTHCVAKIFKKEFARNVIDWAPDVAASKKAKGFADQFAQNHIPHIRNYIPDNEIEFLIPLIAKMKNLSQFLLLWFIPIAIDNRYVNMYEYVALEPFIPGVYTKFNSNGGYEDGMHTLMTAFCHWTWHVSGYKYMVCDLQGVKSNGRYKLTDPAIHSRDMEFGETDLGVVGMERVLGNHMCNELCRELSLPNPMNGVPIIPGLRSTTYSFQVTEQEMLRARQKKSNFLRFIPE